MNAERRDVKPGQEGAVAVVFALLLTVLIGFTALAVEAGQWYLVRAELSKAVDAASMAAAKNISNPFVDIPTLVSEIGHENFPSGHLGTPAGGTGAVRFETQIVNSREVRVSASADPIPILAGFFGVSISNVLSSGAARKNSVEMMLVLDRSGSMAGRAISDLRQAASTFLDFYTDTQDEDKAGLISFATAVRVNRAMGTNFVAPMKTAIAGLAASGATNTEDAIAQAGGPQGFTDQSGIPGDRRVQQYLIFFSDGNPTAFRASFRYKGTSYDAVACGTGNDCADVYSRLGRYDTEDWLRVGGNYVNPVPTGDGRPQDQTVCNRWTCWPNTRWDILNSYPLPGYSAASCNIPSWKLAPYICATARAMAIANAQVLKSRRVQIFTIGLGDVDRTFLSAVASGPDYEYYTPDSRDLDAIFKRIAKEIKLRLVE